MLLHIFKYGLSHGDLLNKIINDLLNNNNHNNSNNDKHNDNSLLLIQNGVYWVQYLKEIGFVANISTYALQQDVDARQINFLFEDHKIKLINYSEFVELIINHKKNINW